MTMCAQAELGHEAMALQNVLALVFVLHDLVESLADVAGVDFHAAHLHLGGLEA